MAPNKMKILVVDDEPNMLHMLSVMLKRAGFQVSAVDSGKEALDLAAQYEFDFILSDVRMPEMDGVQLLERLKRQGSEAVVIIMSAYGGIDLALETIRKGAYDYISKPFKSDEVILTLRKASERERMRRELVHLRRRLKRTEGGSKIVAASDAMKNLLDEIDQIAPSSVTVLITGESGAGKELMAREIHLKSPRKDQPFVAVNCGALSPDLLESELFGHVKGAFTGAETDRIGLFEEADGGVLFLDEIGVMDPSLQVKLLRAIETSEIRRLGSVSKRSISVRLIAATNTDLENAILEGTFREDLYYRLNVVRLVAPPLRERPEDIEPLLETFVSRFNEKLGLKVSGVSSEAKEMLLRWKWRGNVRELQNVIERAMILCEGSLIEAEDLPQDMARPMERLAGQDPGPDSDSLSIKKRVKSLERNLIQSALNRTGGNRTKAAQILEISYPSLLQKIKDYELT
jgi:two-component system response regulator AtoC